MITSYKSRGKPLKVREEGSTVWLLYIFCWKDVLHFKVNDLVSEGGSLLKFEGRISGDPTNWLLCNDFRKESFYAPLLKIFSSGSLESTEESLSERSIGCFLNLFHGRKIRWYWIYERVHSNFFHVGIAKCKYQKWQIVTTNHDFLGKCQRMGSEAILNRFF